MYLKFYLKSLPKVYSNYLKCVMYCFEMSLLFVIIFFFQDGNYWISKKSC